ncbi:hypothetical protein ACLMJK_000535 [Lecanora helva]
MPPRPRKRRGRPPKRRPITQLHPTKYALPRNQTHEAPRDDTSPDRTESLPSEDEPVVETKKSAGPNNRQKVLASPLHYQSRSGITILPSQNDRVPRTERWTHQQSAYVLASYPKSGYPPIMQWPKATQPKVPPPQPQFTPRPSQTQPSTYYSPDGHPLTNIPVPPRSFIERIQLTVALHLYLETSPGPLFDDYTMAQIVFNRIYGVPWFPPSVALLSNMNRTPTSVLGPIYAEVINGRDTWTGRACDAYAIWARGCRMCGVEPPPAWVGRW